MTLTSLIPSPHLSKAAADAKRLGFDTIELYGAHGYLIDQFFWAGINLRNDRFGGSTIGERSRFAAEVVATIRAEVGPSFPIILRVSQWKQQNFGARLAETPELMSNWLLPLVEAGVGMLHCSQRRFWEPEFPEIHGENGLNFAGWAKKLTGAATLSVGSVGLSGDFMAAFGGEGSTTAGLDELVERMERYIVVVQDVRGKYCSEGTYIMTRPPIGPLNPTTTDDTTDAYDTIDWLVKHVPESNGHVGMFGSSYDGWAVVMALLGPHPALKVAAPESPMIDGLMGDDWFHYGAFRQVNLDYFAQQTGSKGKGEAIARAQADDYQELLDAGSAGDFAAAHGLDRLPWWRRLSSSRLRRAVAGSGARQAGRGGTFFRPHHVGSGPVGPGGHLWRGAWLGSAARQGAGRDQPPGDGPVVA